MIALLVVLGSMLALTALVSYALGREVALEEIDGAVEVAKTLGAYGATLRAESAATGITVEALLARDAGRGQA